MLPKRGQRFRFANESVGRDSRRRLVPTANVVGTSHSGPGKRGVPRPLVLQKMQTAGIGLGNASQCLAIPGTCLVVRCQDRGAGRTLIRLDPGYRDFGSKGQARSAQQGGQYGKADSVPHYSFLSRLVRTGLYGVLSLRDSHRKVTKATVVPGMRWSASLCFRGNFFLLSGFALGSSRKSLSTCQGGLPSGQEAKAGVLPVSRRAIVPIPISLTLSGQRFLNFYCRLLPVVGGTFTDQAQYACDRNLPKWHDSMLIILRLPRLFSRKTEGCRTGKALA